MFIEAGRDDLQTREAAGGALGECHGAAATLQIGALRNLRLMPCDAILWFHHANSPYFFWGKCPNCR